MEVAIDTVLLLMLAAITLSIIFTRNLFGAVVLAGGYSFLMATVMVALDAVDVAMTEAAVGAGVSTVLFLGALHLTRTDEKREIGPPIKAWPVVLSLMVGGVLLHATEELPPFGDPDGAIHKHVAPHYLEHWEDEMDIPNVVTSVLASYRGYDTMGETVVVFTAGAGVLILLLGGVMGRREEEPETDRKPEDAA